MPASHHRMQGIKLLEQFIRSPDFDDVSGSFRFSDGSSRVILVKPSKDRLQVGPQIYPMRAEDRRPREPWDVDCHFERPKLDILTVWPDEALEGFQKCGKHVGRIEQRLAMI